MNSIAQCQISWGVIATCIYYTAALTTITLILAKSLYHHALTMAQGCTSKAFTAENRHKPEYSYGEPDLGLVPRLVQIDSSRPKLVLEPRAHHHQSSNFFTETAHAPETSSLIHAKIIDTSYAGEKSSIYNPLTN